MLHRQRLWLAAGALLWSCAPVTFSNEASIDFAAFPRVRVAVTGPDGSERHSQYLESELRLHSGFPYVTRDPNEAVDAQLLVELSLARDDADITYDSSEDGFDFEGEMYYASLGYRLVASDGRVIDSGAVAPEDAADGDVSDAAEVALDKVVFRYLRPYRL